MSVSLAEAMSESMINPAMINFPYYLTMSGDPCFHDLPLAYDSLQGGQILDVAFCS